MKWSDGSLLGFDLETTGIDTEHDLPVSFGFVEKRGNTIIRTEYYIINPGIPIPPEATAVHGIDDTQAKKGITLDQAFDLIASKLLWASEYNIPLVGMNLDYDLSMVDAMCRRKGKSLADRGWHGTILDVRVLDLWLDKWRKGARTLTDLCAHYNVVNTDTHNALGDVVASIDVLTALTNNFAVLGNTSVEDLMEIQARVYKERMDSLRAYHDKQGIHDVPDNAGDWPMVGYTYTDGSLNHSLA